MLFLLIDTESGITIVMAVEKQTQAVEKTPLRRHLLRVFGALGIGGALAVPVGVAVFTAQTHTTEVAAHEVTISPNLNGSMTAKNSLADVRADSPLVWPFGLDITIGNNQIASGETVGDNLETAWQVATEIASQPSGEAAKIREVVWGQAKNAALGGGIIGAFGAGYLMCRRRNYAPMAGGALLLGAAVGATGTYQPVEQPDAPPWVQANSIVAIPGVTIPDDVEIRHNLYAGSLAKLTNGGTQSHELSKTASSSYLENLELVADRIRRPKEGESTILVISDRHDNISMDPILHRTGELAEANYVISLGDETSSGGSWEEFSVRSLAETFKDYTERYAIGGNHDHGPLGVRDYLEERGFMVPNGEVQAFGPTTVVGMDDPRQSDFTPTRNQPGISTEDAVRQLSDLACGEQRPNIVLVPVAYMADEILEKGCADLVMSGDTHTYSPPQAVEANNGGIGYEITVGTSSGAAYAMAAGSKPKRPASAAIVTVDINGRPIGSQAVHFSTTRGEVAVDEFLWLKPIEMPPLETHHQTPRVPRGMAIPN